MVQLSPNLFKWIAAFIVFGLFIWASIAGAVAGRDLARSRATVERALLLQQGLGFFRNDQSRYPSELEYQDGERLGIYLLNFPGPLFTHKKWCQIPPRYISNGGSTFEYNFCLPRGWKDWTRGWHSIDGRGDL